MKKSFMTRALATGLSLAMAFSLSAATNVTTAEAATSKMKVTSKTVTEGKTVKAYMTSSAAKKYRIKSHKESTVAKKYISVAMMSSRKGLKITAKEGALAAANLEKKGVNVKINFVKASSAKAAKKATKVVDKVNLKVVVKAKAEEEKKEVFAISSVVAKSATTLEATFASPVDTKDVTVTVAKAGTTTNVTGTVAWNADATVATFTATANLTTGTYEVKATSAADATKVATGTVTVESEKVAEIVIKNEVALTNADKDEAYIYYDVFNQYGESIRTSTSINWTVSTDTAPRVDKALGRITAKRTTDTYVYGNQLYVTGVYTKTGVTVQKTLTVGMEQSLDSVKTAGFVKATDKNTILDKLPTNFQKENYVMLYQTYDQNGDLLEAESDNIAKNKVTFICDNVLLVKNDFKDAATTYTIDGVEYSAVTVEPGQYVDKGGEVNITAIANTTGTKTTMNYIVGAAAIIKSLTLSQPSEVVADGETATIPYVALDTDGNQITNYESIARTTNTLSLTSSDGTLKVEEGNDGKAVVKWTDKAIAWDENTVKDGVDRSVALTTVVVGGESNNMILAVSDKARPVAIKEATFRKDATTAIVANDTDALDLDDFTYVDQYGRTMAKDDDKSFDNGFFEAFKDTAFDGYYYAVKVEFTSNNFNKDLSKSGAVVSSKGAILLAATGNTLTHASNVVTWSAINVGEVRNETVKFSVVNIDDKYDVTKDADEFDYAGKALSVSYSVVPMSTVTNISIKDLEKQYISLGMEEYKTAAEADKLAKELVETIGATTTIHEIKEDYKQTVGLKGFYKGTEVVIPADYVLFTDDKFTFEGNKIDSVSTGALKLGDFYDATSANLNRKDGSAKITATVLKVTSGAIDTTSSAAVKANQLSQPTKMVTFSDAAPAPAKMILCGETATVNATNLLLSCDTLIKHNGKHGDDKKDTVKPIILDQYGKVITSGITWNINISEIVENAGEFAHMDNSFVVHGNDTADVKVEGAELGDTFTITYTATTSTGSVSGSIKMTVGADKKAYIDNDSDSDKTFRQGCLDYEY